MTSSCEFGIHDQRVCNCFALCNLRLPTTWYLTIFRIPIFFHATDGEVIKLSLASHQQWVSSVAWSSTDANLLGALFINLFVEWRCSSHHSVSLSFWFAPQFRFNPFAVSGSYDGTVKMWDLRSSMPLHTLQAHTDKTLAVDFHAAGSGAGVSLVSGGADNQLQLHRIVQ
jgi:WD40 repeat protein